MNLVLLKTYVELNVGFRLMKVASNTDIVKVEFQAIDWNSGKDNNDNVINNIDINSCAVNNNDIFVTMI